MFWLGIRYLMKSWVCLLLKCGLGLLFGLRLECGLGMWLRMPSIFLYICPRDRLRFSGGCNVWWGVELGS